MARLTWQNVIAPDTSSSANIMINAGDTFRRAMNNLGSVAGNIQQRNRDAASNAELLQLAQIGDAASVDRYLSNIASRINPADMNSQLVDNILGLRSNAQGFDGTRINQTGAVLNNAQQASNMAYTEQGRAEAGGYNALMFEAQRLARAGDTAGAERIVAQANQQYPNMAGRTDAAGVMSNLTQSFRDGESDRPDNRFMRNIDPIIQDAISAPTPEEARTIAYTQAKDQGASEQAAQAAAARAVELWGGSQGLTGPVDPAAVVDATLGGLLPSVPNTADINQPVTGVPDAASIRNRISAGDLGSITTSVGEQTRRLNTQIASVVDGPIQRAYSFLNGQSDTGADMDTQVSNLFGDVPEAAQGVNQFNMAVRRIEDSAGVSPSVAKAALLATVTGDRGFIAALLSNSPNVDISGATEVARQLGDRSTANQFARRSQALESYNNNYPVLQERINNTAARIQQMRRPEYVHPGSGSKEDAIRSLESQLERDTNEFNNLIRSTDSALGFTPEFSVEPTQEQPRASNQPETNVAERSAGIVDQLLSRGVDPTILAQRPRQVEQAREQVVKDIRRKEVASNRVDEILSESLERLTDNVSGSVLETLGSGQQLELALRDMGPEQIKSLARQFGIALDRPELGAMSAENLRNLIPELLIERRMNPPLSDESSIADQVLERLFSN